MTIVFVAVRLITKYKTDFKSMLKMLLRIAGGSVLGTIMGGIILLPVAFAFLNDARMGSGNAWHLMYPLSHYSKLPGLFFFGDSYWLCMGYSAPVILAVFLLFLRRGKNSVLKIFFLSCSVIILIPALGQLLNGMSYMSNKWNWAFALLCAYTFTVMWPELMRLKFREAVKLLICLSICFFSLLMLEYSRTMAAFACIGIAFLFLFVIFPYHLETAQAEMQWRKRKQIIALALVIVGIANVSFFKNASAEGNYAKEAKDPEDAAEPLMLTEANAVKTAADWDEMTDFYRYSGRKLTSNAGTMAGLSSTQYYWSVSSPCIADHMKELEFLETLPHYHTGYDDRTALLTLGSVMYYAVPSSDKAPLPYGFSYVGKFNVKKSVTTDAKELLMEELGVEELSAEQIKVIENATASNYKIYRNDNALPLAYTYDTIISETAWKELSAVKKQEAMLQSVLLAGYDGAAQDNEIDYRCESMDYSIVCNSSGITLEDYGFVVTTANSSVTINFDGLANSETYFIIHGLDFDGVSTYELYFGDEKYDPLDLFTQTRWNILPYADRETAEKNNLFWKEPTGAALKLESSSGVSKTINYYTEDYSYYNDRHDFTVNLCYAEDAVTSITVTFSAVGVYSFDSIEVICQPMDRYAEQVSALKQTVLENVNIGTDTVSGTVSLNEPKILCFSIPYSTGWTAYVDGEETTLYRANVKNMALVLDAGVHDVTLVYHTPYLRIGAGISILGFISVILFAVWSYFHDPIRKRSRMDKPLRKNGKTGR